MITFTRDWRGYAKGSSVGTLADTIEALAVAEGAAIYGGVAGPLNSYLDADNRVQAQVDADGNLVSPKQAGKKTPIPQIGNSLALADATVSGTGAVMTLEAGPNGLPALKIVTGVGSHAEVTFPSLLNTYFYGDAYLVMHGTRSMGNQQHPTVYVSQNDAAYTNGINQTLDYGYASPLNNSLEQGGANTFWFRKAGHSNFGSPTYPMLVGANKVRITPLAATSATVYIYAFGYSAPAPKSRICVMWDDGYDSMFKLGYDSFASRGIKQTLSVIGSAQDYGGIYSYTRQLRAFVDAGNACVAHGPWPDQGAGDLYSAYPGSENPVADAIADMNLNRDWISRNGLGVANFDKCYVWPQGNFQASVNDTSLLDAALAAGFTTGRGTKTITGTGAYQYGTQADAATKYNKLTLPIIGHLWAGTTAAEATNISAITTMLGNLSASRADGILMLHRVLPTSTSDGGMGAAGNITIRHGDLETIAAAVAAQIAAGTMESVTMPELSSNTWWRQF